MHRFSWFQTHTDRGIGISRSRHLIHHQGERETCNNPAREHRSTGSPTHLAGKHRHTKNAKTPRPLTRNLACPYRFLPSSLLHPFRPTTPRTLINHGKGINQGPCRPDRPAILLLWCVHHLSGSVTLLSAHRLVSIRRAIFTPAVPLVNVGIYTIILEQFVRALHAPGPHGPGHVGPI